MDFIRVGLMAFCACLAYAQAKKKKWGQVLIFVLLIAVMW